MANLGVAVADADDFIRAIVIGNLMNVSVLFRFLENLQGFLLGDVMGFLGIDAVIGHVANGDAPIFRVASRSLA